ncbi:MAG TPA: ribonuclease III [Beijerinckiaceae bacterium]|jgi:ribonuclease-3
MPRRKPDLAALEARIGHVFKDRDLLLHALTHMSAVGDAYAKSYQRLEFLGDRVLGLAVAEMLYAAFHEGSEGDLSRRLSELVRRDTCAKVAQEWELGPFIRTGRREGTLRTNRSVLADMCEAVIAAVFLDAGYPAAREVVEKAFGPRMNALAKAPSNPKAALQEWALARGLPLPVYAVVEQFGPDHAPQFRIAVTVRGLEPGEGTGSSKRAAEQDAAEALLVREGLWARPVTPGSQDQTVLGSQDHGVPEAASERAETEARDDVQADV